MFFPQVATISLPGGILYLSPQTAALEAHKTVRLIFINVKYDRGKKREVLNQIDIITDSIN